MNLDKENYMVKHELIISDGSHTKDDINERTAEIELCKYEVTVEGGIFKRGKLWKKGATIELDKNTGQRFVDNKELRRLK
jgi:hypothetical protein